LKVSGIGFPVSGLDADLDVADRNLEGANEVSEDGSCPPNLLSDGGFQVEAVENLSEFGGKQLRQCPALGRLDFGRPKTFLFRLARSRGQKGGRIETAIKNDDLTPAETGIWSRADGSSAPST
jgi:hypothetical protein